jgi:hypothetical protein
MWDTMMDYMNTWPFMLTCLALVIVLGIVYYVMRNRRPED